MSKAIVVGCSAYEDSNIAPLQFAHADATLIATALKETCGLRDSDVVLLADGASDPRSWPTRTNILRHLASADASRPGELVFFFFSGHGFQSARDGAQFLLPIDCIREALEETSLRFDSIVRYLRAREPRHVLLFLDACRNIVEGGKAASGDVPQVDVSALCPPGMVSFCSCEPGRVSYESPELGAGIFSAGLYEGLSDVGRCRTIYELDAFLSRRIPQISAAQGKPVQRPYTRVEPLGVQGLEIVSDRKRNQWRGTTPIGAERRVGPITSYAVSPSSVSPPFLGIDFGTSYSAVSWPDTGGEVKLVAGADKRFLVPSLIHFLPSLDYLVGSAAQEADYFNPTNTVRHVKRLLGTEASFEIEGRSITPELAASLIIRSLWRGASESLGTQVRQCIAAYPANFSLAQRNALERAFELADIDVIRMVAEPNIAALTLHDTSAGPAKGPYMIVDLGGGTFDVAVVSVDDGVYEMMAAGGSSTLGGLDYDDAISAYAQNYLREQLCLPEDAVPARLEAQVLREAGRVKRELGIHAEATMILQDVEVDARGLRDFSIVIDRDLFRDLTGELNAEIRATVGGVLADWRERRYTWEADVPAVFLAGQGTKIFTVREQLEALGLGSNYISGYQETAVVHGLGRQAGVLTGLVRDTLLLNIAQDGIGIRCKQPDRTETLVIAAETLVIAADSDLNTYDAPLADRYATIPTRRSQKFKIDAPSSQQVDLEFVEFRAAGVEPIGRVRIPSCGPDDDGEIAIDIEADGTIVAGITFHVSMQVRTYQMNNLLRAVPWSLDDDLEKAIQGYEVWPLRPITDPEPAPPGVLSSENAAAYIRLFDDRIASLSDDIPQQAHERLRRGMAYQLSGQADLAQADYLRVTGDRRAYTATAARWLASLLPQLPDRGQALDGLASTLEWLRSDKHGLILTLQKIAAELRNAGEEALAASYEALVDQRSAQNEFN
jgi:molecular chaperone DnaK (HSP70)